MTQENSVRLGVTDKGGAVIRLTARRSDVDEGIEAANTGVTWTLKQLVGNGIAPATLSLKTTVPIASTYYQPKRYVIEDVDLGVETTVTTTEDHDYVIGQEVRLIIPPSFGCRQLNGLSGIVLSIPADDQVVLNIYSLGGDGYIASSATTQAQIIAIGDINSGYLNSSGRINTGTTVPGSFINISPN